MKPAERRLARTRQVEVGASPSSSAASRLSLLGISLVVLSGCGLADTLSDDGGATVDDGITIPTQGTSATFDVATWNVEWFGAPSAGPTDEARQLRHVRDVVRGSEIDLWAVQEIAEAPHFRALLQELPGYAGVLANDASVERGREFYSGFSDGELKVGLIFRSDAVEVLGARVVLTDFDHEFAGRPPLEVRVRIRADGTSREIVILVLHAKADRETGSWERRARAAEGLEAYLEREWADDPVLVLGDWNDDVDVSITPGRESPYRGLVDAAPRWLFVTEALSVAGATSIPGYDGMIDHILTSNEMMAWYEAGSAEVFRVDRFISGYRDNTSDHLPVLARFRPR